MAEHPDPSKVQIAGGARADGPLSRTGHSPRPEPLDTTGEPVSSASPETFGTGLQTPSRPKPTADAVLDHGLDRLLPLLAAVGLEPTSTELADILWLAACLRLPNEPEREASAAVDERVRPTEPPGEQQQDGKPAETPSRPDPDDGSPVSPSAKLYPAGAAVANGRPALGFRAPAEPALANALEFYRALRPLHRRVPSHRRRLLDEDTTAERIAEQRLSGHRFWAPAWTPAREPWFELVLVIDRGATMTVWRETLGDLHRLFDTSGAFRRTRLWRLETDGPEPRLYAGAEFQGARLANPESLTAGPERRLILVASDCVGAAWHTGAVNRWLALWGGAAPAALLQLLPQRLWDSTALGHGRPVRLRSRRPGAATSELEPIGGPSLRLRALSAGPTRGLSSAPEYPGLRLPVLTLEPPALLGWGRLLGGIPDAWCGGVQFGPDTDYAREIQPAESGSEPDQAEVLARLADFRATASPLARRLASLLAAAPLTLPVMRLVQRTRLPESGQGHLAEILVSGLLRRHPELDGGSDQPFYDFLGDCRERLLDGLGEREARGVLDAVSGYVAERTGGLLDFSALLVAPDAKALATVGPRVDDANTRQFATVGATVLRRLGGCYAELADELAALAKGEVVSLMRVPTARHASSVIEDESSNHPLKFNGKPLPDAGTAAMPLHMPSPYRGLMAFSESDAPHFFGRATEAEALVAKLRDPQYRFIAVIGASGSGKSSLVHAGLIPRLRMGVIPGSEHWIVLSVRPGASPDFSIALQLFQKNESLDTITAVALAKRIGADPALMDAALNDALRNRPQSAEILMIIDQFEEVFTLASQEKQALLLSILSRLINKPRVRVIAIVRADFFARCMESPILTKLISSGNIYWLSRPNYSSLREMIEGPAKQIGYPLESGLADRIIDDLGREPAPLPLLGFTLAELWNRSASSGSFTLLAYHQLGGVTEALGIMAENVFTTLAPSDQAAFPSVLCRLVSILPSGVARRTRVPLTTFQGINELTLINSLVNFRIIIASMTEDKLEPTIELVHEALIFHWPRLKVLIENNRYVLQLIAKAQLDAADWDRSGRPRSHLWSRTRRKEINDVLANSSLPDTVLDSITRAFLQPQEPRAIMKQWYKKS